MVIPMASWRWLLRQPARRARSLALASAGRSIAARMAMIAITTSNSISVKPPAARCGFPELETFLVFILRQVMRSGIYQPEEHGAVGGNNWNIKPVGCGRARHIDPIGAQAGVQQIGLRLQTPAGMVLRPGQRQLSTSGLEGD